MELNFWPTVRSNQPETKLPLYSSYFIVCASSFTILITSSAPLSVSVDGRFINAHIHQDLLSIRPFFPPVFFPLPPAALRRPQAPTKFSLPRWTSHLDDSHALYSFCLLISSDL